MKSDRRKKYKYDWNKSEKIINTETVGAFRETMGIDVCVYFTITLFLHGKKKVIEFL